MTRRLVLIGGGHAHLHVLRDIVRRPLADADIVLISDERYHHYSGMVPGYLRGQYRVRELQIDLAALARRAGARFVHAAADRVSTSERRVQAAGESIAFDVCSIDVGSAAAGAEVPGVREHAFTLRPMSRATLLKERIDLLAASGDAPVACVVVGGGAGGVEIALALGRRLRESVRGGVVTMIGERSEILPGFAPPARALASRILREQGVCLVLGARVAALADDGVRLASGGILPADVVVWVAGAAPPGLLRDSDLPRDARGYFLVDRTLRALDGSPVWGAGDCIAFGAHHDIEKAGVYAVRQGPVLSRNLRRAMRGAPSRARFRAQRSYLALINTGDGRAILRWHRLLVHARWAWRLKDAIDRRFVRRYCDVTK